MQFSVEVKRWERSKRVGNIVGANERRLTRLEMTRGWDNKGGREE